MKEVDLLTSSLGRYLLYRWFSAWLSYHLSGTSLFVNTLWAVGKIVAALWPEPDPLFSTGSQKDNCTSSDRIKDYAH